VADAINSLHVGTTIVTVLRVSLTQNTQIRDAVAIQLKLDELIGAVEGARTGMVDLEALSDEDILRLEKGPCASADAEVEQLN
jgi:low affinity Fe/Cu permease